MNRILLIDDDMFILDVNYNYLQYKGYEVKMAKNAQEALDILDTYSPDCIVLDIKLPDSSGYDLCTTIKDCHDDIPIIFLSSLSDEDDRVKGFVFGADDYVVKPFSVIELECRIKARIKNFASNHADKSDNILKFGNLEINKDTKVVSANNEEILLTKKEYGILILLTENPNHQVSSKDIFSNIWKQKDNGDVRTVQVHVSNLRRKLDSVLPHEEFIRTTWGNGYVFVTKDNLNS